MLILILDILLALAALGMTVICGLPFAWHAGSRPLTGIALSFALGYVIISTSGVVAAILKIDPILLQAGGVLAGISLCVRFSYSHRSEPFWSGKIDLYDWIVLGVCAFYLLLCLFIFDRVIIWMGGDAVAHAGMVRMLLDGKTLPVSLPGLGSYWEYYPKGFHYYAYLWARAFPILNVIQTVPVLITFVTAMLLYSIVREMRAEREAAYAFVLACLVFPAHYSYLIWGGYPSAAAEMLLVSSVLAAVVKRKLLPILLCGVLLSHARLLVLTCGALLGVAVSELNSHKSAFFFMSLLVAPFGGRIPALPLLHSPSYLFSVFSNRSLASEFIAIWYPAFLSMFGAAIALVRRDRLDRLALGWACATIVIVILADIGLLSFVGTADRLLLVFYLPLSLLGGVALSNMDKEDRQIPICFLMVMVILGVATLGVVFSSYAGSWELPKEDYDAIMWMSRHNFSDIVCINLDETGAWVYPLTGIWATSPRGMPTEFSSALRGRIAKNPNDKNTLRALRGIKHKNILIYISSVSIQHPGYAPPFAEFISVYPKVNLSFSQKNYELLYNKGARIYRLRR